jgi:hypothetical protein
MLSHARSLFPVVANHQRLASGCAVAAFSNAGTAATASPVVDQMIDYAVRQCLVRVRATLMFPSLEASTLYPASICMVDHSGCFVL